MLAGGRSRRMGEDKALAELAGRPLVAHALEVFRGSGLVPRIAGGRTELNGFAPVIPDEEPGRGPLGGVVSALEKAAEELAVFVSIDMPLMAPELVAYLIRDAQETSAPITLSAVNGFTETFPAVVRRSTLPGLREGLEQAHGGCFAAFQSAAHGRDGRLRIVATEAVAQTGQVTDPRCFWPHQWFLNVNTPADLRNAEDALRRAHRIT